VPGERLRKGILSTAFALGLACVLSVALVGAPGLEPVARHTRPLVTLAGLDQDWRLFAPEPPRVAQRLDAVTTWSDGARTVWRIPTRGPWLGAYTDYRWRKWAENAGSDDIGPGLWRATASYVLARQPRRPRSRPVELRLLRFTATLPQAGEPGAQTWVAAELYRARLAPGAS
jgi:hypothetical protein